MDCCALLNTFGVLIVGVLGGEASCSLFIVTGVSQCNVIGVLVNDSFLKVFVFIIYITVFL